MDNNQNFNNIWLYIYRDEFFSHSSFYDENDVLLEFFIEENDSVNYGDVYRTQIIKINPHLKMVFLAYHPQKRPGFMNLKTNHEYKVGDYLTVQVIREEQRNKGAMFSPLLRINTPHFKYIYNEKKFHIYKDNIYEKKIEKWFSQGGLIQTCYIDNLKVLEQELDKMTQFINLVRSSNNSFKTGLVYKYNKLFAEILNSKLIKKVSKVLVNNNNLNEYEWMLDFCQDIQYYKYSKTNLNDLLTEQVQLKSGGYILIQSSHIATVIDVNTGKSSEITLVNKEACVESMKQIRLRNISGLIFIDFLKSENYDELNQIILQQIPTDMRKIDFIPINELGVANLSRQSISPSLHSLLMEEFPYGFIKNAKFLHYELNIKKPCSSFKTNSFLAERIQKIPHNYKIFVDNSLVDVIPVEDSMVPNAGF